MSAERRYLFVGGFFDGKVFDVPENYTAYELAEPLKVELKPVLPGDDFKEAVFSKAVYTRRAVWTRRQGYTERVHYFALSSLSDEQALELWLAKP